MSQKQQGTNHSPDSVIWEKTETLDPEGEYSCRAWFSTPPEKGGPDQPVLMTLSSVHRLLLAAGYMPTGQQCDGGEDCEHG